MVGDDGELILKFMVGVLGDESARMIDRLEAAKWLADRGFGKAVQAVEIDVPVQSWESVLERLPTEDLATMRAILWKHELNGMVPSRSLGVADRGLPRSPGTRTLG